MRRVPGYARRVQRLTMGEAMNALMRSAIVLVLSMGACTLLAQSLGDVARENRNTPHPRAKRVVTNDEIPSVDTLSTAPVKAKTKATAEDKGGDDKDSPKAESKTDPKAESKAGGDKAAPAKELAPASAASELEKRDAEQKKQAAEWNSKFSLQREKISVLERDLKVGEQEFQQKQLVHMSDVNARVNGQQQYAESERLDKEDLAQRQQKLNEEREKLGSMQEEARRAGVKLAD